ncbi:hypothetical protein [Ferruginibacter sp.]
MKNILGIIMMFALLSSCKKDNLAAIKNEIAGTWELRSSATYSAVNNFPPGNGYIIEFGNNNSYKRKKQDTLLFEGKYTLTQKKDCYGTALQTFITTTQPNSQEFIIAVIKDTLTLNTSNCLSDGAVSEYTRK